MNFTKLKIGLTGETVLSATTLERLLAKDFLNVSYDPTRTIIR